MTGALWDISDLNRANSAYLAMQLQSVNGLAALRSLTGRQAAGGVNQSAASISGPGQLLSDLQQLQTQNPNAFQQVVSQIAGKLQTAAQQASGPSRTFLSNLAAQFQSVADGGSLSLLQPQNDQQGRMQQAYSRGTQSLSQGVAGLAQQSGSQSSDNSTLQQLFSTISGDVSQALGD